MRDPAAAQDDAQPAAQPAAPHPKRDDAAPPAAQPDRGHARVTRTVATKQTTITEVIDVVADDTVRQIVADWLADGRDVHDPALTTRVERALGRSRRTAQLHLQPARQAAAATTATAQS